MTLSHIVLRRREPNLERPYLTPGGVITSGVACVLAVLAVIATFIVDVRAALIMLGVYALFIAYFALYSRHHLVAQAPEEEFATIEGRIRAGRKLEGKNSGVYAGPGPPRPRNAAEVDAGRMNTVLIAMTDMQGRLQGKRLTASHFLDEVVEHDAEGCNYLLAVDVDMNTVEGYAMSSWERGYGDFVFKPTSKRSGSYPGRRGRRVTCDLCGRTAPRWSPRPPDPQAPARAPLRARAGSSSSGPSSSSSSSWTPMRKRGARVS